MLAKLLALLIGMGMVVPAAPEVVCEANPGQLEVPILLYHHIAPTEDIVRFTVSPIEFEEQMNLLSKLGYQTITPGQLMEGLTCGALLPEKPIMITFDDGHADVFQYAFPILERYGYSAAMYVVANRTGAPGFLSIEEMKVLLDAGWEIGSHTFDHPDLARLTISELDEELVQSRRSLESELQLSITSLAYPFGSFTPDVGRAAVRAGYTNAMGLGIQNDHALHNRYYLSRREVVGGTDAVGVLGLLQSPTSPPATVASQLELQTNSGVLDRLLDQSTGRRGSLAVP